MSKKNKKKLESGKNSDANPSTNVEKAILEMSALSDEHKGEVKRIRTLSAEDREEEVEGMLTLINDETDKMTEILKDAQAQSEYIEHLSVSLLLLTGNYEEKK